MLSATCEFFSGDSSVAHSRSQLVPAVSKNGFWHRAYQLDVELPETLIEKTVVTARIRCEGAWYLSPTRRLTPLRTEVIPPFPVGRFVVSETPQGMFKWDFPRGACFRFRKVHTAVEIEFVVQNRHGCGLTVCNSARMAAAPQSIRLEICRDRLRALSECLWVEPYPEGARAAVCLTDHADFDSVDKLALLTDLFLKHDIRFTKSVFPVAEPLGAKREPGLDVPVYRALVAKLYEHGSEIAFHGFGPRKRAPSAVECFRRSQRLLPFRPSTWIDHGSGEYLYSRAARLDDGTPLTHFLEQFGIVNYWSYLDIWDNPFGVLSCWKREARLQSATNFVQAVASMPDIILHAHKIGYQLVHLCKNVFGDAGVQQIRKSPVRWRDWRHAIREGARMRRLRAQPMVIYGEDGVPANIVPGGRWVFDTVILNHLGAQLRPRAIDALCKDSGLLLAHCYMSGLQAKCTHNCLVESGGKLQITPSFLAATEYLSYRQRERDIASLPFRDLRKSLEAFATARLIRHQHGWSTPASSDGGCRTVVAGERRVIDRASCDGFHKRLRGDVGYIWPRTDMKLEVRLTADTPEDTPVPRS